MPPLKSASLIYFGNNHFNSYTIVLLIFLHFIILNNHFCLKRLLKIIDSEKGQFIYIDIRLKRIEKILNSQLFEVIRLMFWPRYQLSLTNLRQIDIVNPLTELAMHEMF